MKFLKTLLAVSVLTVAVPVMAQGVQPTPATGAPKMTQRAPDSAVQAARESRRHAGGPLCRA